MGCEGVGVAVRLIGRGREVRVGAFKRLKGHVLVMREWHECRVEKTGHGRRVYLCIRGKERKKEYDESAVSSARQKRAEQGSAYLLIRDWWWRGSKKRRTSVEAKWQLTFAVTKEVS